MCGQVLFAHSFIDLIINLSGCMVSCLLFKTHQVHAEVPVAVPLDTQSVINWGEIAVIMVTMMSICLRAVFQKVAGEETSISNMLELQRLPVRLHRGATANV